MKQIKCFAITILLIVLSACGVDINSELTKKANLFEITSSTRLYEYLIRGTGGATGDCNGIALERWYGSQLDESEVEAIIESSLKEGRWENQGRSWFLVEKSFQTKFTLSFEIPNEVQIDQFSYSLPLDIVDSMQNYHTIYRIYILNIPKYNCEMWQKTS